MEGVLIFLLIVNIGVIIGSSMILWEGDNGPLPALALFSGTIGGTASIIGLHLFL